MSRKIMYDELFEVLKDDGYKRVIKSKRHEEDTVEECILKLYDLAVLTKKLGVKIHDSDEFKYIMSYLIERMEVTSEYKFMNTWDLLIMGIY